MHPWLGYAASPGARVVIRKIGQPYGQCATVQRQLPDDRIVARIDGYSREDGVKGETLVDLQPSAVVPTTAPYYARGTKLLLLHNGDLVDALVLYWLGGEACVG